jgi:hypothetical protein
MMLRPAFVAAACLLGFATTADADPPGRTAPGEVIEIHEQLAPRKLPVAVNYPRWKAPPYSAQALQRDAWTRAWLLVDIDANGDVTRFKWLKRPGYDLEAIAETEVWKLKFSPAIDASGNASRLYAYWKFEWVAQSWNTLVAGNTQGRLPNERQIRYVPCEGSGPWQMGSAYKGYRDCSRPDISKAQAESWIRRPSAARAPAR